MYSKEEIIEEVKRVAKQLGKNSLKESEFEQNSMMPLNTVIFYMGSWPMVLKGAGLEPPQGKTDTGEPTNDILLRELVRLFQVYGESPTEALVSEKGKYAFRLYMNRWRSLNDAFERAIAKFPTKPVEPEPGQEPAAPRGVEVTLPEESGPGETAGGPPRMSEGLKKLEEAKTFPEDAIDLGSFGLGDAVEEKPGEEEHVPEEDEKTDSHIKPTVIDLGNTLPSAPVSEIERIMSDEEEESQDNGELDELELKASMSMQDDSLPISVKIEEAGTAPVVKPPKGGDKMNGNQKIKLIAKTIKPKIPKKARKMLGEPVHFRGLRYAPVNRTGVAFLFGMVSHEVGYIVEALRPDTPNCEGKRCLDTVRDRWEQIRVEFEFRSSDYQKQGKSEDDADIIVCWKHDWEDCPLEVLELHSILHLLEAGHQ